MLAIAILFFGIFSRIIVHAPNFTPVIALALFSGVYLSKKKAIFLPVALMILSDLILGLHDTIFYTWGSMILISVIGIKAKENKAPAMIAGSGILSAVLFFVITNFGAWPTLYPLTWQGLLECYIAGIPYFRNTLLSTLVYSAALFGIYEAVAFRVRSTRWANLLLSA